MFQGKKPYFCIMISSFSAQLEAWYREFGRDLPWRQTSDPFLIMLSEFILQQTQIVQGMSYYLRFAERFPSAESLANASEEEVMRLWQGLGYYSRARNLRKAAQEIAKAGHFPKDYSFIRALPGVGDYTAAAIMSFAFGEPYAVLDGNVQRVLARHFGINEPVDTTQGKKLLRALADEMLDRQHPALYNQAIMDFGALQCKPTSPLCDACPLAETCQALKEHQVDKLPVKAKRTAIRAHRGREDAPSPQRQRRHLARALRVPLTRIGKAAHDGRSGATAQRPMAYREWSMANHSHCP